MYSTVGIRNTDKSGFRMVDMFGFQMVAASIDRFICKKIIQPFENLTKKTSGFRMFTVFEWSDFESPLYSNGPPSHVTLPFEYQTPILSGIQMNPVFR